MCRMITEEISALEKELSATSLRSLSKQLEIGVTTLHNLFNKKIVPRRKWQEISSKLATSSGNEKVAEIINNINKLLAENEKGEDEMILRKQNLTGLARQHFGFVRNPLQDPRNAGDLYFNKKSRFVRECLLDAAQNGNFLALVGESGSGKSTLRMELIENLKQSDKPVIVIEPYTLNMSHDGKGGTLKSRHLLEAILTTLNPNASVPLSPQILAKKVHKALLDSYHAGFKHCLVIEEAHDISVATLKALKRFWELTDGMERLLSIMLVGQPELSRILGTNATEVREVVQRCDVIELGAIDDVADFLAFKFKKAGLDVADFFEAEALEEIANKLHIIKTKDGKSVFYSYPLAIANMAVACINRTAELGLDKVNAEIVRSI